MKIDKNTIWDDGKFRREFLDITYLIVFALMLFHRILQTTMFGVGYPTSIKMFLRVCLVLLVLCKLYSGYKVRWYEVVFAALLAGTSFLVWRNAGNIEVIDVTLLVLGAKDVRFDRILKTYLLVAIPCMVVTIAASQIGLVENLVYHRGDIPRASFGFVYPTDFVAHLFFVVLAWCALRKDALRWWEYVSFLAIAVFSYVFCNARMNVLCIILAALLCLMLQVWNKYAGAFKWREKTERLVNWILVFGTLICAGLMNIMTRFYNPDSPIWQKLNQLVTYRLEFGKQGFDRFGVTLFGQELPIVGMGGTLEYPEDYFFLDSSYVKLLLEYGLVLFGIVVVMFTVSAYRARKEKHHYLLIALLLMAVQCAIEHHILEIAYNPFLFMLLAEIVSPKPDSSEDKRSGQFS